MGKKSFSKPALSIEQQLDLLKKRGLIIENEDHAKSFLANNNYYRLEGYWFPFYEPNLEEHIFRQNVSLSDIENLYYFDNEFRKLLFESISEIEISFKSRFANQLSLEYGPFPFDSDICFQFKTEEAKIDTRNKLIKDFTNSKEDFIEHFRNKYSNELPPIWMLVEIATFGEVSNWYDYNLKKSTQKAISHFYGLAEPSVMASWLRQLTIVRNLCAHHARTWNKVISITPVFPQKLDDMRYSSLFQREPDEHSNHKRIYNVLLIIQYLLAQISGNKTSFLTKVEELTNTFHINIQRMGFLDGETVHSIIESIS